MQLQIKKVNPNAIIPTRNNPTDSGLDIAACLDNDVVIDPIIEYFRDEAIYNIQFNNKTADWDKFVKEIETNNPSALIPTGIAIKLPESDVLNKTWEAQIRPRSGLAAKHGISCHLGTIDNEYIGELKVVMYNFSNKPFVVTHGMKIAQLVIQPVFLPTIELVEELGTTTRGSNGFGSSGI